MFIVIIKKKRVNEIYYVFCARNESVLFSNVIFKRWLVFRKVFLEQTGCTAVPSMPHGNAGY